MIFYPRISTEVVLCDRCKGHGYTTEHVTTDYHRGEYDVVKHACVQCDGKGRLKRTTRVTLSKLDD